MLSNTDFYIAPIGKNIPAYVSMTATPKELTDTLRFIVEGFITMRSENKVIEITCNLTQSDMNEWDWQRRWGHLIGWNKLFMARKGDDIDLMLQTDGGNGAVFQLTMVR